mgnify:FL=1
MSSPEFPPMSTVYVHARKRPDLTNPRPGNGALCGFDHRDGATTTYARAWVTCPRCIELKVRADAQRETTNTVKVGASPALSRRKTPDARFRLGRAAA